MNLIEEGWGDRATVATGAELRLARTACGLALSDREIILGLTTIIVLGVGAQWIARRSGFPSLLLLLPAGLVAGATGLVDPEALLGDTLFPLSTMLVALLLFQAGLNLRVDELPRVARSPVVRLVTIGLLVTFGGATGALLLATDLPLQVAVIIGAILTVSGPTVVGPLLRVIRPRAPMRSVLEWEGTVLDPIGATLGVVTLNIVLTRGGDVGLANGGGFLGRVVIGVGVGAIGAALLVFALSRFLLTDDMEAPAALLMAVLCFGVAEMISTEAGLFATVTLGILAANQRIVPTARISGFGETFEVLIIAILFILLGALVPVSDLVADLPAIALVVALLVLVVRPVSVALSLAGTALPWRDRALAAWMEPRGVVAAATAATFATQVGDIGLDGSRMLPIVFGVILGTGLVYGLTSKAVALALGVSEPKPRGVAFVGDRAWLLDLATCAQGLGAPVLVLAGSNAAVSESRHDGLPTVSVGENAGQVREQIEVAPLAQAVIAARSDVLVDVVVAELVEQIGRSHVFVMRWQDEGTVERFIEQTFSPRPFGVGVDVSMLDRRANAGGQVQVCRDGLPPGAIPLAAVRDDGSVDLRPGRGRRPQAGTLIALVGGEA